ncbi:hypothetical protein LTR62_005924 [Meristemomyces frigidus]|uniref:Uncharacterized protein n=1 Tax=Meristemomyces frigidus TaxID=1508187 RepID=A0AAN7YMS8_9PEZI|nr:hypothetical protein LTR62_005924 [Meristemomyces frigidus]
MNTTSLLLNGQTAASFSLLPERKRATLTTLYSRPTPTRTATAPTAYSLISSPPTPRLGGSSPAKRPDHKRSPASISRESPGWYNTEDGMTLDDFAERLNSLIGRFERWQGKCAQNVVMALMRPTPIVLFVFNPVALVLWMVVLWLWLVRG